MRLWLGVILLIGIGGVAFMTLGRNTPVPASTEPSKTTDSVQINTITPTKGTTMNDSKQYAKPPEMTIDSKKMYTAVLETTKGVITLELDPRETPQTVNNFVFLAREGFYTNTPFHRILKGFMIQGGDPTGTGRGGPGYRFADEPVTKSYTRGTIAMANAGPNTNGSQFFIMHDNYELPKNYVIFGKIKDGDQASLTTLDAIATSPVSMSETGEPSKPTDKIVITKVTITE